MNLLLWDFVAKSFAISAIGFVAVALMRRSSAATRHLTMVLTLAGMLALPLATAKLPRWQVPFLRVEKASAAPALDSPATAATLPTSAAALPTPSPQAPVPVGVVKPIPLGLGIWAAVAFGMILRVLWHLIRLRRLESSLAMAGDSNVHAVVTDHCRRRRRHVLLLEGFPNEAPMTWGHFRPVLLVPSEAQAWPSDRLDSVVLHELAHIERADWIATLVAQIAVAVNWFNPLAWVLLKRIHEESEIAADDHVLGSGLVATQYATHLMEVLRDLRNSRTASRSALAMAGRSPLDGRVRAILEEHRCRRPARGFAAVSLVGSLLGAVAIVATAGPTWVTHSSAPQAVVTSGQSVESSRVVASSAPPTAGTRVAPTVAKRPPTVPHNSRVARVESSPKASEGHPSAASSAGVRLVSGGATPSTVQVGTGPGDSDIALSGPSPKELEAMNADIKEAFKSAQGELKSAQAEVDQSMAEATDEIRKQHLSPANEAIAIASMKLGVQEALKSAKLVPPFVSQALAGKSPAETVRATVKKALGQVSSGLKKSPPTPTRSPQ